MERLANITRDTKETQISLELNIDGEGNASIDTGIGFFNHMLEAFTKHGLFDMNCKCDGDIEVDGHHSVEDTGIVLGEAIRKAVGDKTGIKRFGNFILPMDDALVLCAVDLCNRPYLGFDYKFESERIGELDTELIKEFFQAVHDIGYDGPLVIESFDPKFEELAGNCAIWRKLAESGEDLAIQGLANLKAIAAEM